VGNCYAKTDTQRTYEVYIKVGRL